MLIPASKGGGQQIMDVPRECSLQHLLELVMNTYFPGGKSEEQNLEVADLSMFVASFSGRPLPEVIGEKSFTVGTYFDSLKSYPVRIYLHTRKKEQADASSTEHVANSTGTDDVTDTGTPTIVFNERPRRRRLLELRQRITQMTSTTDLSTLTEHHIAQNIAMADEQNNMPSDAVALISDAVTGHQLDRGVTITDPFASIADDSSEFHVDQDSTHPNLDEIREDAFTDPQLDQDESYSSQSWIQDATSPEDVEEISDWILEQGLPLLTSFDEESKVRLVNLIIKNSVYYRLHAEIAQFQTGLNLANFMDIVTCHKDEMSSLFTHMRTILTVDAIKGILQINYSPDGSNDKQLEDDTIYSFEVFLQDCMEDSAEVTLCDLLAFWTGASEIPPLGFHKKLEIDFVTDTKQLPVAHTCGMSLELPRGVENPDELKRRLVMAVEWGGEFHLA